MQNRQGALLDEASFNNKDLNLERLLKQLGHWQRYDKTAADEVIERLRGVDIAVANKVVFSREVLEASPALKLICLTATGTDNVDLICAKECGIAVRNVTDYCTNTVAQHVFALMLALTTQLFKYSRDATDGSWSNSDHFSVLAYPIHDLAGKTLGLIGYGTLARGVETLARAFGMNSVIANRPGGEPQAGRLDLDDLLHTADIVSLHCPLTDATRGLIGAREFSLMKSSAFLINTARGAIVDNAALANALINGEIAGAGIDVLEKEPPLPDHPLLNSGVPNLVLTPHIAWASIDARQRLLDAVADNLHNWLIENHD